MHWKLLLAKVALAQHVRSRPVGGLQARVSEQTSRAKHSLRYRKSNVAPNVISAKNAGRLPIARNLEKVEKL